MTSKKTEENIMENFFSNKTHIVNSDEEMRIWGEKLAKVVDSGEIEYRIFELIGDLGAGKTTFFQGVARYFGMKGKIISPTFVIQKNYTIPLEIKSVYKKLIHIDAYRLTENVDAKILKFDQIINDKENLIFIEWPERVGGEILGNSRNHGKIIFEHVEEQKRKIKFECGRCE